MSRQASVWLVILLVLVPCAGLGGAPDSTEKAKAVLDKMEARIAGLKDFTARLQARVSLPLLPGVRVRGRVLYKKPNKVKVELDNLPRFIEAYKSDFSGMTPTGRNRKDYVARYVKDEVIGGRGCHVIQLEPRNVQDKLKLVTIWVDRVDLTIPKAIAEYDDGSVVGSLTSFSAVGRFLLPAAQQMVFTLPRLAGQATATYTDYKVNTGLTDAAFKKG